jgi:hypothetical protein
MNNTTWGNIIETQILAGVEGISRRKYRDRGKSISEVVLVVPLMLLKTQ